MFFVSKKISSSNTWTIILIYLEWLPVFFEKICEGVIVSF